MNKSLRSALRFAAYIRAMGDQPLPIEHRNPRQWALDLQRQHERLRQNIPPEFAKAAKVPKVSLVFDMRRRRETGGQFHSAEHSGSHGHRTLGATCLDMNKPKLDHCNVVFLAEMLCRGGDVACGTVADCCSPLKSEKFALRASCLDDSIRQQGETVIGFQLKA